MEIMLSLLALLLIIADLGMINKYNYPVSFIFGLNTRELYMFSAATQMFFWVSLGYLAIIGDNPFSTLVYAGIFAFTVFFSGVVFYFYKKSLEKK